MKHLATANSNAAMLSDKENPVSCLYKTVSCKKRGKRQAGRSISRLTEAVKCVTIGDMGVGNRNEEYI